MLAQSLLQEVGAQLESCARSVEATAGGGKRITALMREPGRDRTVAADEGSDGGKPTFALPLRLFSPQRTSETFTAPHQPNLIPKPLARHPSSARKTKSVDLLLIVPNSASAAVTTVSRPLASRRRSRAASDLEYKVTVQRDTVPCTELSSSSPQASFPSSPPVCSTASAEEVLSRPH